MQYQESVLATIGNTPLIKLSRIANPISATVFGKVECYNPGQSAKDRIALHMVEQAEKRGELKPGATIVEATSGNTGYSLAMIASLKGYGCVLTVTSKASQEKLALLRSMGAEVIVCPADAEPDDPRSYYQKALQLSREIPNAFYIKQNFNMDNSGAHFHTTGPEIWEQTGGKITHYVCCAGTGGTLSGTAQYLKEKNPNIKIIAVDAYGSVLAKYWQTGVFDKSEIYSYKIEGLGKTIIPDNVNFDVIDEFVKVTDKNSALRTRELALKEGLLVGYSSGAAMECVFKIRRQLRPQDVVVVLFPDHGTRYLGKVYNDEWMKQHGFLDDELPEDVSADEPSYRKQIKRIYQAYKRKYGKYLKQTLKM
ncbi:MAG: cysteine synthase family protein [Saprospiraceae bacterium]|nr:cysteine synthase family protein [Saprospiraceae bacterium]